MGRKTKKSDSEEIYLPTYTPKIDGFIKIYDGIKYLVLFSKYYFKYDQICEKIEYLIKWKK